MSGEKPRSAAAHANNLSKHMLRALRRAHETINCHQVFIEGLVFGFITSVLLLFSGREATGILLAGTTAFLLFLLLKEIFGIGNQHW